MREPTPGSFAEPGQGERTLSMSAVAAASCRAAATAPISPSVHAPRCRCSHSGGVEPAPRHGQTTTRLRIAACRNPQPGACEARVACAGTRSGGDIACSVTTGAWRISSPSSSSANVLVYASSAGRVGVLHTCTLLSTTEPRTRCQMRQWLVRRYTNVYEAVVLVLAVTAR